MKEIQKERREKGKGRVKRTGSEGKRDYPQNSLNNGRFTMNIIEINDSIESIHTLSRHVRF